MHIRLSQLSRALETQHGQRRKSDKSGTEVTNSLSVSVVGYGLSSFIRERPLLAESGRCEFNSSIGQGMSDQIQVNTVHRACNAKVEGSTPLDSCGTYANPPGLAFCFSALQ